MRKSAPLLLASCFPAFAALIASGQYPHTVHPETVAQISNGVCERLAGVELSNVVITTATVIPSGTFSGSPHPFTGADLSSFYKTLPTFCRVIAHARPTADSDITIEVWMPVAHWNGRLQGIGNGGFAGRIDTMELGWAMSKGYAAVATDTGHDGSPVDAAWALGHPEKIIDFGHRGIHEMTRVAKMLAQEFYGSGPKHSYFEGCSDGGREALMEAQRYPADYDGIIAGAPANDWTNLLSSAIVDTQALTETSASFIPPSKIPAIGGAVIAACDALDGVRDGILNDPRQCRFDPAVLACKPDENTDKCLTAAQVTALKKIYAGMVDADGHVLFPGYLPGAEEGPGGWGLWITGPAPAKSLMAAFGTGYFSDMVYDRADWDLKSFRLQDGLRAARQKTAGMLDAVNPDLSAFRARGGKLILYHGWNDPAIPALSTIDYYEHVVGNGGQAAAESFVRLYMIPGMQHCAGGPGSDAFGQSAEWPSTSPQHNVRLALEEWVEKGTAPDAIVAAKVAADSPQATSVMTRLICPYPQEARYKGKGDPHKDENYACSVQKR